MSRMTSVRGFALVVASLVGMTMTATTASADFVYTSQTRSATATYGRPGVESSLTLTAPNFGVFDATATAPDHPSIEGGNASQRQRSELLPGQITVQGAPVGLLYPAFGGTGYAWGRTITDVLFEVTNPTAVTLQAMGTVIIQDPYFGVNDPGSPRSISLTGPGTDIVWDRDDLGMFPRVSGNRSATAGLLPGTYRLLVDVRSDYHPASGSQHRSETDFTVTLTEVPEPSLLGVAMMAMVPLVRRGRSRRRG
jgi:hypothetical protein